MIVSYASNHSVKKWLFLINSPVRVRINDQYRFICAPHKYCFVTLATANISVDKNGSRKPLASINQINLVTKMSLGYLVQQQTLSTAVAAGVSVDRFSVP